MEKTHQMFTKEERSSFKYWFAHWCAFQMTALNLKVWKPHMLFHDWYKPWMKLFCDYKTVQKFHRTHSKHHIEYMIEHPKKVKKMNWLDMVIDWECSRFTKAEAQLDAADTLEMMYEKYDPSKVDTYNESVERVNILNTLNEHVLPILHKLSLQKKGMYHLGDKEFTPRDGDFAYFENSTRTCHAISIIRKTDDKHVYSYAHRISNSNYLEGHTEGAITYNKIFLANNEVTGRFATESEKKEFLDDIKKQDNVIWDQHEKKFISRKDGKEKNMSNNFAY